MHRSGAGVILGLAAATFGLARAPAAAEIEIDDAAPRIFSIEPRPYRLGHEFQLGLGVLPLDAFYVGAVLAGSYTYHFSDFWAWELAGAGYSYNFDTPLRGRLYDDYRLEPVRGGGTRIHLFGTTALVAKPLFGKIALFNEDVIAGETFFTFGGGPLLKGPDWLFSALVGIGFRFWSSERLSVRFDVRDYLPFAGRVPHNTLFVMLSAAFNFHKSQERR